MSINFPLLESKGKESKGKRVKQEAYGIHRLKTSSCFHDFLNLKQYSILLASTCIESLSAYTSHAEVVLRFLLKL